MKRKKLGEVLRERGKISPEDLLRAIEEQQGKVIHLGELMLERGLVAKNDLIEALAEVSRIPYADAVAAQVDPEALKLIPSSVALRFCVMPLNFEGTKLVVAMAEPQNLHAIDELRFLSGTEIVPRIGFRSEIKEGINKWYRLEPADNGEEKIVADDGPAEVMEFVSTSSLQRNIDAMQEMQAELMHKSTPAMRLVSQTISAAVAKQASDIHIEPQSGDTAVRVRVDGMLRDLIRVPRALQNSVVSRIKILADMDIAERRAPQDGRFMVKLGSSKIDLRVSTLPTQHGEKVVMRLLQTDVPMQQFENLGLAPAIATDLRRIIALPQGMLLVTGPTGSGKSTTLYSALSTLRKPTVNIITVEDPVEYALPGINQVQVNNKAGLTFANCLRSILRQDPNVIMVGEIRDKETAEIALKAAQTGHFVLSTLHTNDSVAAVSRLVDLGVPGFMIAGSVSGIVAQRLVRRLCTCRSEMTPSPAYRSRLIEAGMTELPDSQLVPVGCNVCDGTGYKGRVGVYELLIFNDAIRSAVRDGARNDEMRNLARSAGMKLMQEYALERVKEGLTTIDEISRVIPFERIPSLTCDHCHRELQPSFSYCPYCGCPRVISENPGAATLETSKEGAVRG
ncbi:MAG TPA: ATPase, T2SS/T4P/T4SS family [Candidatus Acidoferrales bacterium]|nr:ATPase, T2SS/T4P/T4SS family [Candidatus Acidoferrales bacterium]